MRNPNVLYLGNNLLSKTGYPSTLQILSEFLQSEGYNIKAASSKSNVILRMLDMFYSIFKHQKRTDIVLIDAYSTLNFYYTYFCVVLLKCLKKPYIPILHGGNLPERLKKSPKLSKAVFSNAFINVAPSGYLSEVFQQAGFKTTCIPNTLKIEQYGFKHRKKVSPKLLFVRAFTAIYNPLMAIRVLFELKKDFPNAKLCMVGPDRDGTLANVKALAKELDLESSVEFTGVLPKEEWHKKSENFDIFINTSNVDNMPVSIIEAMALGLPVVTTNVGGMKYLVEDKVTGFLVKPNDVQAMTKSIKYLIENGSDNMTQNARKQIETYQWKVVKHQWNKLLSQG
ncbi:glycosyltransferase family 4 protein [Tamlana flava]|uniref:glycosyltransferase family 4 protein n=1 Tax=Tamlana flava TaxID=3158572 RepID=UPI00351B089A